MEQAVIIDSTRTAIGKLGGTLQNESADYLGSHVIKQLHDKTSLDKSIIDEVILGQAKQSSDASNIARVSMLRAGMPVETPGFTVHRQCGSGLQSINSAAQQIWSGINNVIIAGGVESMSSAPYYANNVRFGVKAGNIELKDPNISSQPGSQPLEIYGKLNMGITAENIAEKFNISREEQDEFALKSHLKAMNALKEGYFKKEITPFFIQKGKEFIEFKTDEHPRETSIDKLKQLQPVFKTDGTVTPGNSSGRNDGASALLIMSKSQAVRNNYQPKVQIISQATSGVNPELMGMGPVLSTKKALKKANLHVNDIDIIELNEAFSSQSIACIKELGLDIKKVNPNGGAIALGHPIGATGAILMTKLIHYMERTGKKYGLVTLCIAGGMGVSTIIENMQVY